MLWMCYILIFTNETCYYVKYFFFAKYCFLFNSICLCIDDDAIDNYFCIILFLVVAFGVVLLVVMLLDDVLMALLRWCILLSLALVLVLNW